MIIALSGVSGSGKTHLAWQVASALRIPLLSLDAIKEVLADSLLPRGPDWPDQLGTASCQIVLELVRAMHGPVVLDVYWRPSWRVLLQKLARPVVEVYCTCPQRELRERLERRLQTRHSIHQDAADKEFLEDILLDADQFQPLRLGPLLRLDTSLPLDVPAVCEWLRSEISRLEACEVKPDATRNRP